MAPVIHIHNGDVVAAAVKRANIPGEHVAYRESLVAGPVIPGENWIELRANAIAEAHNQDLLRVRTDLLEQEQWLDRASSRGEVVLWFEHDLYCLIHLIYLLQRFGTDANLSVVWCPFPLSENEDRGLHLLFESRDAVTPEWTSIARKVWRAYTSADPTTLNEWLRRDTPDFPFLREGIALHASRFPSDINGLGAIEQRALTHIANGFTDFATLFDHINSEVPRFGFGDSEVFRHLKALAQRPVPLITLNGEMPKTICNITPAGEKVLRGELDDIAINDPDVWLGGAHLTRDAQWRWNGTNLSAAS